jgi:hypothetical protein
MNATGAELLRMGGDLTREISDRTPIQRLPQPKYQKSDEKMVGIAKIEFATPSMTGRASAR